MTEWKALLSVRHQPDTCVSCVASKGGFGPKTCRVGDRPSITRCQGNADLTRLAWQYIYPGQNKTGGADSDNKSADNDTDDLGDFKRGTVISTVCASTVLAPHAQTLRLLGLYY
jgi:hypothetical protein